MANAEDAEDTLKCASSFQSFAFRRHNDRRHVGLKSINQSPFAQMHGFPDDIIGQFYKIASVNLCPNTNGQVCMSLVVDPPKEVRH